MKISYLVFVLGFQLVSFKWTRLVSSPSYIIQINHKENINFFKANLQDVVQLLVLVVSTGCFIWYHISSPNACWKWDRCMSEQNIHSLFIVLNIGTGFARVLENLESRRIWKFGFQAWGVWIYRSIFLIISIHELSHYTSS